MVVLDNKNRYLSNLDTDQMSRKMFDESMDAQRVVIVGSDFSGIRDDLVSSFKDAFSKVPSIIHSQPEEKPLILTEKSVEYREIEKPVIVTEKEVEYREIEKPIIVKELQIERVEVPVFIEKIQIKEVEKPIYIEKQMPIPNWMKIMLISQTIALIAVLIFK